MSDFEMLYRIEPDSKVIVTQTKGVITMSQILEQFKLMSQDTAFNVNRHYFHDFRDVEKFEGSLSDHEKMAEFAVTIASNEPVNVVFLVRDNTPSIQKYLEGYSLMASESNRNYWIIPESEVDIALEKVGLQSLPAW